MTRRLFLLLCLAFAAPAALAGQQAQHRAHATRIPVTIALVASVPHSDQPFVVQRRPNQSPADIILLRTNATAEQLSEAITAVTIIRQAQGDYPTTAALMRVRPHGRHAHHNYPWVPRVLADVHRAPVQNLPEVGNARSVTIWLPRTRGY